MTLLDFFILSIPIITASTAQILFKKGISSLGKLSLSGSDLWRLILGVFQDKWLFSGMILFVISFVFYLVVLSKFDLNFAYPVMVSVGIIFVAIASWFLFGEKLSLPQILGMVLIIFGIFLLVPKS